MAKKGSPKGDLPPHADGAQQSQPLDSFTQELPPAQERALENTFRRVNSREIAIKERPPRRG